MADIVSPAKRSRMMAGIRGKNTKPELQVRRLLHAQGFRFRLHRKDLPGNPDIVLPKHRVAVFVHGCFWHGHENCHLFRLPKSRIEFWEQKIGGNTARDEKKLDALLQMDWRVLRIWECSLKGKTRMDQGVLSNLMAGFVVGGNEAFGEVRGEQPE